MHPDIEKLITLALADGVVSEKEREIILRKAEKLGLDIDEVEMYLEGKISSHNLSFQAKNQTHNKINEKNQFDPLSILTLDKALIEKYHKFLKDLTTEIQPLIDNPEIINERFIQWMKDLKNNLETVEGIFKKLILVHKRAPHYGQFGSGDIYSFTNTDIQYKDKIVLGKFESPFNRKHYILCSDSFVEYERIDVTGWFKSYINYDFKEEESFNLIDIFNEKYVKIFRYFISEFLQFTKIIDLQKLLHGINLKYDDNKINELINTIPDDPELSIVYKVNIEIKNLIENLNKYLNSLDKPYKVGVVLMRNAFIPYHTPIGYNSNFGYKKSFFSQLDLLDLKIKFIIGIISLRNDLIYSIIKKDKKNIQLLKIKVDQSGLLMNYYESNSLNKLDDLIQVVSDGLNEIKESMNDIVFRLEKLDQINDNLQSIDDSVNFGNLLSMIQNYQIYKVNKNIKEF
jgi:hypothetical protein